MIQYRSKTLSADNLLKEIFHSPSDSLEPILYVSVEVRTAPGRNDEECQEFWHTGSFKAF